LAQPPRKADNPRVSALQNLLASFRDAALTNRERGTYFEELVVKYLTHEPAYRDLYREVLPYADWADRRGLDKRDAGIDLVAETFAGDAHAIQCKLYAADYRVQKADLDSFFTASGKRPFSHRLIVATTSRWSDHAEEALRDQHTPVTKLDLGALEQSVIDWSRYAAKKAPRLKPKKSLRPHQQSAVTRVAAGLAKARRGKLIMACGTGKTFTSLKIA
jgi:predicted helicase